MTNSEWINILDITSDVTEAPSTEVATDEVTTGETPPFGSADSAVVVKTFEDYRGRSKQEAINYVLELKDDFLYTVERLKRQEYRQTWLVKKGYYFGALLNYCNGAEVKDQAQLETAAIATYKAMYGEDAEAEFLPVLTLNELDNHLECRRSGDCTAQEVIDLWERFKHSMTAIYWELSKLTKKQLTRYTGHLWHDYKKDAMVSKALDDIRDYFHPKWYSGGSQSYGSNEDILTTIDAHIDEWTDELIHSLAEARRAALEARKEYLEKATTNPESLEEFGTFFRMKGKEALTPELQARYEALIAKHGIEERFKDKARKASSYSTDLPEGVTLSEVIETKHTRDGYDLFVVQLSDRVEKPVYQALDVRAKKLGGWYSGYSKGGAVPGFQFKERDKAEQFRSLEYVDGAQRVEEKLEAKKDRASDRLLEQAETLKEDALERLNAPRLENTVRRANIAASMEYQARADLQLAETMENLAHAIADREVEYVDQLYTRAHVEQLERILSRARGNACIHEAKTNTADYKWERDRDLRETDINFALFPYPTLHKDVLIQIIKVYWEKPGFKMLCDWLNKDAGQYFHKHPQQNLYPFRSDTQITKLIKLYEKLKWWWSKYTNQRSYFTEYEIDRIKAAMEDYERLNRMNITNNAELRTALREYWQLRGEQKQTSLLRTLMRELVGRRIPNYHPTPQTLAARMVELLEIEAGMSLCEPSCGMFHLIDALAQFIDLDTILVEGYEINTDLIEICRVKYPEAQYPTVQVHQEDFLRVQGKQFNRFLANPPFRNPYASNQPGQVDLGADIQHVMNMYMNLAPQGRIVAVMGTGAFTRSDNYAVEFQSWFRSIGGEDEVLDAGTFLESDRPTGAATRLVVINKSLQSSNA